MSEQPTNGELKIMHDNLAKGIGDIKDSVKEGFDGVHKRLDTANHRTAKNEEAIKNSDSFIERVKGGLQVFVFLFGIIATILGFLVGNLYNNIDKLSNKIDKLSASDIANQVEKQLSEKYEIIIE